MRRNLDEITWHVMDATADDWESIEQIASHVQRFPGFADAERISEVIAALHNEGLLEQMTGEASWYRMTPAGGRFGILKGRSIDKARRPTSAERAVPHP